MTATKIKRDHFVGTSRVFTTDGDGLAAVLRGLAIDNARLKVEVSAVHDFTDNSTGTNGTISFPGLPSGSFDATSAGGATASALNTSLGKAQNAAKVMTNTINVARALLGLTALVCATGTEAAADTIPAQDKTNASTSGSTSAAYASTKAALAVAEGNMFKLAAGANEVLTAIGATAIPLPKVNRASGVTLGAIPTVTASADGTGAAKNSDVVAELVALANAVATIAAAWNAAMNQSSPGALHVVAG